MPTLKLDEWQRISQAAWDTKRHLNNLLNTITDIAFTYPKGSEARRLLLSIEERLTIDYPLSSLFLQDEWTGGDSSDPSNTEIREPNCVPFPQTYSRSR